MLMLILMDLNLQKQIGGKMCIYRQILLDFNYVCNAPRNIIVKCDDTCCKSKSYRRDSYRTGEID